MPAVNPSEIILQDAILLIQLTSDERPGIQRGVGDLQPRQCSIPWPTFPSRRLDMTTTTAGRRRRRSSSHCRLRRRPCRPLFYNDHDDGDDSNQAARRINTMSNQRIETSRTRSCESVCPIITTQGLLQLNERGPGIKRGSKSV